MPLTTRYQKSAQNGKKKPPPRPPPPKFSNYRSKSTLNLNQNNQSVNLIEFNSPPSSPKTERVHHFGGSISSSFSSSTSSLSSSKKSFELETLVGSNLWPIQTQPLGNGFGNNFWPSQNQHSPVNVVGNSHTSSQPNGATFQSYLLPSPTTSKRTGPPLFGPTIIRAQNTKKTVKETNETSCNSLSSPPSPPMPNIPPPSPPKIEEEDVPPYGIALYDFEATQLSDLALQENDVVLIIRRVNSEWLYGKVLDREGIFPENFIDIKIPLKDEEDIVTALYEFEPQMTGDLALKRGRKVKVTCKVSDKWLYGQTDVGEGQFPANYVNRIPKKFR